MIFFQEGEIFYSDWAKSRSESSCLESALIVACAQNKRGPRIIFIAEGGATSDAHVAGLWPVDASAIESQELSGSFWKDQAHWIPGREDRLACSVLTGPRVLS